MSVTTEATNETKTKSEPVECWHFIREDRRLGYDMNELIVKPNSIVRFIGTPKLCEQGLHGSVRAIDALHYAPGPVVCRVQIGGEVIHGNDKLAGTWRKCLWLADATNTLHEFACLCAEDALRTTKVDDVRCWQAIETKRKWLKGEATDDELAAARAAALDAAWDAARAAAWDAARAAAWDAAWDAALDAARDAALDAAWAAALDAARAAARAAAWDAAWDAALAAARDAALDAARAAALDAARAAALDAARAAALDAARAAARAAALDAALDAARAAAWDAAWDAQNQRLESMLMELASNAPET